ncbi:MAG: NAAT family transporter [Deltaproteobacteria bacterium]|nr:NAAT family transporter [Deltaproteobacteria bacterium]
MSGGLTFLGLCLPSLLSIVDPLAAVPVFVTLVAKDPRTEQRRTAMRAVFTMTVMLALFAAAGNAIFHFFGITVPAFKIAGGVLLFSMALEMMRAHPSAVRSKPEEEQEAEGKQDVGIVPLGIPLLSGPGAIATAMMWAARAKTPAENAALYGSILFVGVVTLLTLVFSTKLLARLGKTGINIATRIMGLILAATAAQFLIDGIREAMQRA